MSPHPTSRPSRGGGLAGLALGSALWIAAAPIDAAAQEPVWSLRASGGVLVSSARSAALDPETDVTLGRAAPVVTIDLLRQLDGCCLELFLSATLPRVSVTLSDRAQTTEADSAIDHLEARGQSADLHERRHLAFNG